MTVTLTLSDDQHRRALALVRCQALIEHDVAWEELRDLLETDRPLASTRAPVADFCDAYERRRLEHEAAAAKAARLLHMQVQGLDATMAEARELNR